MPSNRMLMTVLTVGDTLAPLSGEDATITNTTAADSRSGAWASDETALLRLLPAAPDLLLLALVLHLGDGAEHLQAELAVGLLVDFQRALVLHDVARGGIDHDLAARAVGGVALERRHHLVGIVEIAIELLDDGEDGGHRVPSGRRHEVGVVVRPIGLVPGLDERPVGRIVEINGVAAHDDRADGGVTHG